MRATAAAVIGADIDVPEILTYVPVLAFATLTSSPGARSISFSGSRLEKPEIHSLKVIFGFCFIPDDPTGITPSFDGLLLSIMHAGALVPLPNPSLPDATIIGIPKLTTCSNIFAKAG